MKDTMIKAAVSSGEILMDYFGKLSKMEVKENQGSIVTEGDFASEKNIIKIIQTEYPDHNIVTEESGFINNNSEYTWIIDPVDGTSNYFASLPWFGILIGFLKGRDIVMGAAYLPFYKDLYFAETGKGAFKNDINIHISAEKELKNILIAYSADYTDDPRKLDEELSNIGKLIKNTRNIRATNCLIDHVYTAEGRLGGTINKTMKIWDIAVPYILIKEAGGVVTDLHGNCHDFKLSNENYLRNYDMIGANKFLHPKLVELLK